MCCASNRPVVHLTTPLDQFLREARCRWPFSLATIAKPGVAFTGGDSPIHSVTSEREIMKNQLSSGKKTILSLIALSTLALSARANLVTNGEFSFFEHGGATNSVLGPFESGVVLKNWKNTGPFAFVFGPNAADTTGAFFRTGVHNFKLWGPNSGAPPDNTFDNYSPNQMNNPKSIVNFVSLDADPTFPGRTLSQTIQGGLVQGQQYVLSYFWAAAQYTDSTGATDSGWGVTIGNQTLLTGYITGALGEKYSSIPSQGFSGWIPESIQFIFAGNNNILQFMAQGNPGGRPPVVLLDSVSLNAIPEPVSLSLVGVALLGLVATGARRKRQSA